jgi:hypothetical protein
MATIGPQCANSWLRFIYTHNPFYVISAALVLYGLHVSFAGSLEPTEGWLLMRLLAGYTLMLAGAGIAVVKLGRVWEDARGLILLVILLVVAIASSFDRVCLDDDAIGAMFLGGGFAFAIIVCELIIRVLRLKLPLAYRGPIYLQLAVLFAYPVWLGRLSINDREVEMAWYVLALPTVQAIATLLLVPAARRQSCDVADNGTPWGWPLYPWTALVLLGGAGVLRSVAMSMSFDNSLGFRAGLQAYAFIPLGFAWLVLWVEGTSQNGRARESVRAFAIPFVLIWLALPGIGGSPAQTQYLSLLEAAIGSPVEIAAWLSVVYFAYLWRRGLPSAEFGLACALVVLTMVDGDTRSLDRLAPLQFVPAALLAALLVVRAVWLRSSLRTCALVAIALAGATYSGFVPALAAHHGYLAIHLALAALLITGLVFRDAFARGVNALAPVILTVAAVTAAVAYRFLFPTLPPAIHAATVIALAVFAELYRRKNRRLRDLEAVAWCFMVAAGLGVEHLASETFTHTMLRGKRWLAWGVACFAIGLAISLVKGGTVRRLYRRLRRMHLAERRARTG